MPPSMGVTVPGGLAKILARPRDPVTGVIR
jgi:hypothetical protein